MLERGASPRKMMFLGYARPWARIFATSMRIMWRSLATRSMMGIMSTFDVRHPRGDLLVHLLDESFNPKLRQILDEVVPTLPHGEITQGRIDYLRKNSHDYPKLHLPDHEFGPICLEVLQPSTPVSRDTWAVLTRLTDALIAHHK